MNISNNLDFSKKNYIWGLNFWTIFKKKKILTRIISSRNRIFNFFTGWPFSWTIFCILSHKQSPQSDMFLIALNSVFRLSWKNAYFCLFSIRELLKPKRCFKFRMTLACLDKRKRASDWMEQTETIKISCNFCVSRI